MLKYPNLDVGFCSTKCESGEPLLGNNEISRRLSSDCDESERIAIVPQPNLEKLLDRGGMSIDLRLGRWFVTFDQSKSASLSLVDLSPGTANRATKEHFVPFGEKFTLHPGRFALGVTLEWIRLPASTGGQVLGKSSLGRNGLIIETASGVHPSFSGCLTLELANVGEVPLDIHPGMEIAQLFLHSLHDNQVVNPGKFSGRRKPVVLPLEEDEIYRALRASDNDVYRGNNG